MKPLERIIEAARRSPRRIALAEGEDPRIVEGACRAAREGLARITLVGTRPVVEQRLAHHGVEAGLVTIEDPASSQRTASYAAAYHELRRAKGVDEAAARRTVTNPLAFAAMMVRQGDADGTVGGAVATTADTVRTALQIIGRAPGSRLVSSFFLMMLCEPHHVKKGAFVFADCGLVVEPDTEELAEIALASAGSYQTLTGAEAKVAMLSFSTTGSAAHERVTKVAEAARLARAAAPDLLIDGELQFDAAFLESVSLSKAPNSTLKGAANVFVFPNLDAANIGYKIAQRIGGAAAIGPILQGLAKPANDLSRGCNADDVYNMIAVTVMQAAQAPARP
jgi:phosphate acetyltransferase